MSPETRAWLGRCLLSLLLGLLAGGGGYLVARALTTAYLFYQQAQFVQTTTGLLRGGIESLASSNLRELRLLVEARTIAYHELSMQVGFVMAALVTVGSYTWLERRAARDQAQRSMM